jgi:rhodanese-related sulfurtransferase
MLQVVENIAEQYPAVTFIDAVKADALIKAGEAVLIDVREPDEYEIELIPSASLVPLNSYDIEKIKEIAGDLKIITVCYVGRRSAKAAQRLLDAGVPEVYSVTDGMVAWEAAGLDYVENTAAFI